MALTPAEVFEELREVGGFAVFCADGYFRIYAPPTGIPQRLRTEWRERAEELAEYAQRFQCADPASVITSAQCTARGAPQGPHKRVRHNAGD